MINARRTFCNLIEITYAHAFALVEIESAISAKGSRPI